MTRYFDNWKNELQHCVCCKWSGLGSELNTGEVSSGVTELNCPACDEKLLTVAQPTYEEVRANWEKADESERMQVELGERHAAEFERRKLSAQDQLPDINAPAFVLVLDDLDGTMERVIRYGDRVLHSEPRYWEDWDRYEELAVIVREKYGPRVIDLVPTRACYANLLGDSWGATPRIRATRKRVFGGRAPVDEQMGENTGRQDCLPSSEAVAYYLDIGDNFHYMDSSENYKIGPFQTAEAALDAARKNVDDYLLSAVDAGMTAQELFESYMSFGEDPAIVATDCETVKFSAWEYAEARCKQICGKSERVDG